MMPRSPKDLPPSNLIEKVEHYCAYQERCRWDLDMKLRFWKVSQSLIPIIMKQMVDEKFIDEERYARSFVRGKFHVNKWGRIKISQELRRRNISETIIRKSLHEIGEEDYLNTLRNLIIKKKSELNQINNLMIREKIITFVIGKGFEHYLIEKILTELNINHDHT